MMNNEKSLHKRMVENRFNTQNKYIGLSVTLNGTKAIVRRTPERDKHGGTFAEIVPLDTSLGPVGFSWAAIYNICDNHNGEFHG